MLFFSFLNKLFGVRGKKFSLLFVHFFTFHLYFLNGCFIIENRKNM